MGKLRRNVAALASAGAVAAGAIAFAATPAQSAPPSPVGASPYLYPGWGNPPKPSEVSGATGVKDFTLAFILSGGGCDPAWDGNRPLDGPDKGVINDIRSGGGDVIPSIGGANGQKLGETCPDEKALAAAYQKVIDAYGLNAIDIDIEATEFENEAVQDRVLNALKIVKQAKPGLRTVVTFPTLNTGPNQWGERIIKRGAELGANVDVWSSMTFDFSGKDMVQDTIKATDALKDKVKAAFNYNDADAYAHTGITAMNGKSDQSEITDVAAFQRIADYAKQKALGRLSFWSVNRDRPCTGGGNDSCSGIDQQPWAFTKVLGGFSAARHF